MNASSFTSRGQGSLAGFESVEAKVKWAFVNGASIRYSLEGKGPRTLVLLHELGGTLESWDDVVSELDGKWRVLRLDWRGSGLSQKIETSIELDTLSSDLRGLLTMLGVSGPVYLAGCAVGGAIALHYAAQFAADVAGVVAMCPATKVTEERREASLRAADEIAANGMAVIVDTGMSGAYPERVRQDQNRYQSYLVKYRANDPRSFAAILRMVAHQNIDELLSKVRAPTLILAGAFDGSRPLELVKEVADLVPGAVFKVVESAHFMPIQTPELVAREIEEFFA